MLVGTYLENPILNYILYEVEFPDGTTKPYAANMIAQNIHDTVDSDGHRSRTFGEILNYCADGTAVSKENRFGIGRNGRKYQRKTTAGWKMLVSMKDGSEQWYPLKDLKVSNPVQVAEYAVAK